MTNPLPDAITVPLAHVRDRVRPRLRGVLHQYAFLACLVTGIVLVALVPDRRARVGAVVYAVCLAGLFGISALYHRRSWGERGRRVMARLDHSMIFVFIAGTYTPFALLVLRGTTSLVVLVVVWAGAAVGVATRVLWLRAPRFTTVPLYLALGWTAAFVVPQLIHFGGVAPFVLLVVGGAMYSVGGIVYAARRPDPAPAVFGYHEVFHAMTCAAAVCHYIAISFAVYAVA
ncbi:MAG TPA: hemolysin III family protein [Candidatus Limnocylindrales bacterium]|nr:hemolysin III family protein [Candidatus Limnocylindrales bacterium]